MKNKKDNTFLYIISTSLFIILGIILTSVINSTQSSDVRTRASATAGVEATAVVTAIDSQENMISVQNLSFTSSPEKNLGSWNITPPSTFSFTSIIPGTTIRIIIDSESMNITEKTFTAKEVKKK